MLHIVRDEIIVNNFHTATGLRLESDSDASLVKLDGNNAGYSFRRGADIDDRVVEPFRLLDSQVSCYSHLIGG